MAKLNKNIMTAFWVLGVAFLSCKENKNASAESQLDSNAPITKGISENNFTENGKKADSIPTLKYFYVEYPNDGMAMARIPFPANWEQHKSGEYEFTGPTGIMVYPESGRYYSYSNDPSMMEMYQYTGANVKYPMDMEQSINEILVPIANTKNMKMVKKYPVPSLMEGHRNFSEMLFRNEPSQRQYNSTAIEWVQPDGTQWITVYHYSIEQYQNGNISWGFTGNTMGAPPQVFKQAKQDYLNGLLNKQINPQWINLKNRQSQVAVGIIEEADRKRTAEWQRMMADRKQQWDTYQEN